MIHIIILLHFACVTVGSVLLIELMRKVPFKGRARLLVLGVGFSDLSFALDTMNIYCRHWYKGYSSNEVVESICTILFCISLVLVVLYFVQVSRQRDCLYKRSKLLTGGVFTLCYLIQMLGNLIGVLKSIPWCAIGYMLFCVVQIAFLFGKLNQKNQRNSILERSEGLELLTSREQELVRLISEGKSNKEIAGELSISQNTVRNHIYNIYRKLEVKNKIELVNKLK